MIFIIWNVMIGIHIPFNILFTVWYKSYGFNWHFVEAILKIKILHFFSFIDMNRLRIKRIKENCDLKRKRKKKLDVIGDGKIERKMAVIIFYFYAIYLISCIFRYHKSGSFIMQEYAIKEQKKVKWISKFEGMVWNAHCEWKDSHIKVIT